MNPEMIAAVVQQECERFESHVLELLRTNTPPPEALERVRTLQYRAALLLDSLTDADAEVQHGSTDG